MRTHARVFTLFSHAVKYDGIYEGVSLLYTFVVLLCQFVNLSTAKTSSNSLTLCHQSCAETTNARCIISVQQLVTNKNSV